MSETEGRTQWEVERHSDKKAYQIRKQQEVESKRAMRDFKRHMEDEVNEMRDREWGDD